MRFTDKRNKTIEIRRGIDYMGITIETPDTRYLFDKKTFNEFIEMLSGRVPHITSLDWGCTADFASDYFYFPIGILV